MTVLAAGTLAGCGNNTQTPDSTLMRDGKEVKIVTLRNSHGMEARITNFGGRIMSLLVPDREGKLQDVVLGFDSIPDYYPENHQSDFGATIGRYANRLGNGQITVDGQLYQLPQNNGRHCLHGGPTGWQYQVFEITDVTDSTLSMALESPDGDNGFPGNVTAVVTFTLREDNSLEICYNGCSDATTVINMTNHSYFNLSGDGNNDILDHLLTIDAEEYTPIDDTYLPLGFKAPVAGTPFDFRQPKAVGADIATDNQQLRNGNGYDHNWVLNPYCTLDTRPCACLECPKTGIGMKVYTTEPGLQVYTGNFLDGSVTGKGGKVYGQRNAICLETQKYPNSPNNNWPESNAYLAPDEMYVSTTVFSFFII